jgi:hypothetical protein
VSAQICDRAGVNIVGSIFTLVRHLKQAFNRKTKLKGAIINERGSGVFETSDDAKYIYVGSPLSYCET